MSSNSSSSTNLRIDWLADRERDEDDDDHLSRVRAHRPKPMRPPGGAAVRIEREEVPERECELVGVS